MSVTCVFGMTESGKSRLFEKFITPQYKRVIAFDPTPYGSINFLHQISMDASFGIDNAALNKVFEIVGQNPDYFRISLLPGKKADEREAFDKLIVTTFILSERIASQEKRILLACDEASDVCSHNFQSSQLQKLVKKGRHYGVDSLFIAQYPQMIHTNIRANCSKIYCFRITTAEEIEIIRARFGRDGARKIANLPNYHYATWDTTGSVTFTDDKGKKYKG